ncbi:MAG: NAD(P)H-dependent oxidoreductase subunit E, partial [Chloroflexi bacterium]|nr:NAD(P)H-dependent oxidoreductase subunit E [Chloroflexota bacterium]
MAEALEEIIDLSLLDPILAKYGAEKGAVIPVLQQTQEIYGYLPKEVLQAVARGMSVPLS